MQSNESFLEKFNCKKGDLVTIHFLEYRDDRVRCFQAEQKVDVYLVDIHFVDTATWKIEGYDNVKFYYPVLSVDMNKANIHYNQFISWCLYKDNELILEHICKEIKIPGTYKRGQLKKTRERCLEIQKVQPKR